MTARGERHSEDEPQPAVRWAGIPESRVERVCKWASGAALWLMLLLIGADIVTRSLLNFSFEISDELSGYLLVAIAFLSLSVCQSSAGFHHVELVQSRLSPRARARSRVAFDLLALCFALLLLWQFGKLEISSWRFGERAPTFLETPLWLPRLTMALGALALCCAVCRTLLAHVREALRTGRQAHE